MILPVDFVNNMPRTIGTVITAATTETAKIPTMIFFVSDHLQKREKFICMNMT